MLPNVPRSFTANAAPLNHTVCDDPSGGSTDTPVSFARSLPMPSSELSVPLMTVYGRPVWNCMTPVHCQPPSTHCIAPSLTPGRSQTHDVVKRWR